VPAAAQPSVHAGFNPSVRSGILSKTEEPVLKRLTVTMGLALAPIVAQTTDPPFHPDFPKVWDDEAMREVELPLAARIPVHRIPSEFYYRIPVRPNVKTYPIYVPEKEPKGYWEWLQNQEPQPAFDPSSLHTKEEWIKAGELVFEAPLSFTAFDHPFTDVRNPKWYEYTGIRADKNGVIPYYRYAIRKKGTVEVNLDSCAECHTRLMPDGTVVKGAQGNVPFNRIFAYRLLNDKQMPKDGSAKSVLQFFFGAPWIEPDPTLPLSDKTLADLVAHLATIPPGVTVRQGTSVLYPPQVPDLIGLQDRLYLDHTGMHQHRSIVDLMRYAAINNFINEVTDYNGYRPMTGKDGGLPDANRLSRSSDQELYALALFIYSLKPPPNPNRLDTTAANGKKIFEREGCVGCHTPPLYTNNMITPARGFAVPEQDRTTYRILNVSVGTDPFLATKTRRGTGYYKIPSLKGVWYRGPIEHNGSVARLEDWFDPTSLRDDYIPTGYRGYGGDARAVKGHEFGLKLGAEDKKALIAFLVLIPKV
jgi:hypothetical protein